LHLVGLNPRNREKLRLQVPQVAFQTKTFAKFLARRAWHVYAWVNDKQGGFGKAVFRDIRDAFSREFG
jgi:hypothetical protein